LSHFADSPGALIHLILPGAVDLLDAKKPSDGDPCHEQVGEQMPHTESAWIAALPAKVAGGHDHTA